MEQGEFRGSRALTMERFNQLHVTLDQIDNRAVFKALQFSFIFK